MKSRITDLVEIDSYTPQQIDAALDRLIDDIASEDIERIDSARREIAATRRPPAMRSVDDAKLLEWRQVERGLLNGLNRRANDAREPLGVIGQGEYATRIEADDRTEDAMTDPALHDPTPEPEPTWFEWVAEKVFVLSLAAVAAVALVKGCAA